MAGARYAGSLAAAPTISRWARTASQMGTVQQRLGKNAGTFMGQDRQVEAGGTTCAGACWLSDAAASRRTP